MENPSYSWPVTMFLAWTIGFTGAHHFFTGNKRMGIIYLFTCGGFGIGVLVDWVNLWTNNFKDSNGNELADVPSSGIRAGVALFMVSVGILGAVIQSSVLSTT